MSNLIKLLSTKFDESTKMLVDNNSKKYLLEKKDVIITDIKTIKEKAKLIEYKTSKHNHTYILADVKDEGLFTFLFNKRHLCCIWFIDKNNTDKPNNQFIINRLIKKIKSFDVNDGTYISATMDSILKQQIGFI